MTRKLKIDEKWEVLEISTSTHACIRVERLNAREADGPHPVRLATSYLNQRSIDPTDWIFRPRDLRQLAQICNEIADNLEYRP